MEKLIFISLEHSRSVNKEIEYLIKQAIIKLEKKNNINLDEIIYKAS